MRGSHHQRGGRVVLGVVRENQRQRGARFSKTHGVAQDASSALVLEERVEPLAALPRQRAVALQQLHAIEGAQLVRQEGQLQTGWARRRKRWAIRRKVRDLKRLAGVLRLGPTTSGTHHRLACRHRGRTPGRHISGCEEIRGAAVALITRS